MASSSSEIIVSAGPGPNSSGVNENADAKLLSNLNSYNGRIKGIKKAWLVMWLSVITMPFALSLLLITDLLNAFAQLYEGDLCIRTYCSEVYINTGIIKCFEINSDWKFLHQNGSFVTITREDFLFPDQVEDSQFVEGKKEFDSKAQDCATLFIRAQTYRVGFPSLNAFEANHYSNIEASGGGELGAVAGILYGINYVGLILSTLLLGALLMTQKGFHNRNSFLHIAACLAGFGETIVSVIIFLTQLEHLNGNKFTPGLKYPSVVPLIFPLLAGQLLTSIIRVFALSLGQGDIVFKDSEIPCVRKFSKVFLILATSVAIPLNIASFIIGFDLV